MIYYNKKINPIERHYDKITEEIATVFIKSIFTEDCETKKYINLLPGIKKVIYNKPATIILWKDNTKTISICDKEIVVSKSSCFKVISSGKDSMIYLST